MYYSHDQKEHKIVRTGPFPPMPVGDVSVPLVTYIESRGLNAELAMANGWYGSSCAGDSYNRVVMPAINRQGVPYWQARLLDDKYKAPRYQSPSVPRYDSIIKVIPAHLPFYSYETDIVIVEGPFDALAMAEVDYESVALMGNAPPSIVFDHIWQRYEGRFVYLISDADSIDATVHWQAQLAQRGMKSKVCLTYGKKDVAELSVKERKGVIR